MPPLYNIEFLRVIFSQMPDSDLKNTALILFGELQDRGNNIGSYMDIKQLLQSTKQLTTVDLTWAKEVIDTEVKLRAELDRAKAIQEKPIDNFSPERRHAVPRYDNNTVGFGPAQDMGGIAQVDPNYPKQNLHFSDSGATSSHVPLRYDLIPRTLLDIIAQRYTIGADIHGAHGYQKGLDDRGFIINRINHIQEHWVALFHPDMYDTDGAEGHIGAIAWGLGFLAELTRNERGWKILSDIISEGVVRR